MYYSNLKISLNNMSLTNRRIVEITDDYILYVKNQILYQFFRKDKSIIRLT